MLFEPDGIAAPETVTLTLDEYETIRLMDRESRNHYVDRVCRLARRYCVAETAVARAALALCQGKEGVEKEAGYWIICCEEPIGQEDSHENV